MLSYGRWALPSRKLEERLWSGQVGPYFVCLGFDGNSSGIRDAFVTMVS